MSHYPEDKPAFSDEEDNGKDASANAKKNKKTANGPSTSVVKWAHQNDDHARLEFPGLPAATGDPAGDRGGRLRAPVGGAAGGHPLHPLRRRHAVPGQVGHGQDGGVRAGRAALDQGAGQPVPVPGAVADPGTGHPDLQGVRAHGQVPPGAEDPDHRRRTGPGRAAAADRDDAPPRGDRDPWPDAGPAGPGHPEAGQRELLHPGRVRQDPGEPR